MTGSSLLKRLFTLANAVLVVPVGYLGALTAISMVVSRRTRRAPDADVATSTTRFVVLVPAHNEGSTIGVMLESIRAQNYPSSLYTVHVVADNCTDDTAALVAESGANVHERFDGENRGKGPALNWLVRRLVEDDEPFDAAVFIDADTTVSPAFLGALDRRFQSGARAVQGFYGVREAFESTPATLRYCALAARHHARPLARCALGGSCGLFGNGMAFTRDLVIGREWTDHLVEDMEFQLELLLDGVRVEYEPLAMVEAEMPHTFAGSVTQHRRWELGRIAIARRFLPKLLARVVRPNSAGRLAAADAAADMIVPPLSVLAAATVASTGLGVVIGRLFGGRSGNNATFGAALVAIVGVHVVAALRLVDAPRAAYRSLLHAPQLALWKLWILVRPSNGDDGEWIRTRRNAEELR